MVGAHVLKVKAYVQKEVAAGTRLNIGVPLLAEASGRLFPDSIEYCNEAIKEKMMSETDAALLRILRRKGKFNMSYFEWLTYLKLNKSITL